MKLSDAIKRLESAGIENARGEARMLFSHFLALPISELLLSDIDSDCRELITAIQRRAERYPLQYIIGSVHFYKESYKVSPDCLIPRSDTEILVDVAVKRIPKGEKFIDLCTGSGCIALSTLNNTELTSAIAVDISEAALSVACENAEALGLSHRIEFRLKDVLSEPIADEIYAVLSNPPYVSRSAYEALSPEIYHEPKIAFLGGEDGLDFYRRLIPLYKDRIKKDGFIAFEIGYDQTEGITEIGNMHLLNVEIIKDYGGLCRVAILTHRS